MNNLQILLIVSTLFIVITVSFVLYFYVCQIKDNYYISPIRGSLYDPDIVKLSGGMAGYNTMPYSLYPYDYYTPDYYTPDYYTTDYYTPDYYTPDYYTPDYYTPEYYTHDYYTPDYYTSDYGVNYPDPVFDNPRVKDLLMSEEI